MELSSVWETFCINVGDIYLDACIHKNSSSCVCKIVCFTTCSNKALPALEIVGEVASGMVWSKRPRANLLQRHSLHPIPSPIGARNSVTNDRL